MVEDVVDVTGFDLGVHEGVAVVVMAHVVVVEPRHRGGLVGSTDVPTVPVRRQDAAIGIPAWNQEEYHVFEDVPDGG